VVAQKRRLDFGLDCGAGGEDRFSHFLRSGLKKKQDSKSFQTRREAIFTAGNSICLTG
jgi:hypothetical protein